MKQWLYKGGSSYDKVKIINQSKDYRGGIATRSISVKIYLYIRKTKQSYLSQKTNW